MSEREQGDDVAQGTDESSKSYGEHVKDAAHDLKEDTKDVFRRGGDDEEEESSEDDGGDSEEDAGAE